MVLVFKSRKKGMYIKLRGRVGSYDEFYWGYLSFNIEGIIIIL